MYLICGCLSCTAREITSTFFKLSMKDQLINLRDRLTDLTRRNRSLRLLRLYNKWNFDLFELEKVQTGLAAKVLTRVMSRYANIRLTDLLSDNEDELIINNKLKTLARNINEIEVEKGLFDLYVGYPFIKGRLLDETFIQAPIFLIPVRIEKKSGSQGGSTYWSVKSLKDEEVLINRTLILGLQKYNEINISEQIFDETEELPKSDWLNEAEKILNKYSIKSSLEQEYRDEIITRFTQYRTKEIPDIPPGKLAICPFGVLGHFPQSTSALLRDYDMMLNSDGGLGLVSSLLRREEEPMGEETDGPGEISIDEQPEAENIFLLPTDNSQEEVLVTVRNGKNLVVHGPPGTGKSQVIVNIIGEAVCKGKKILVVCQKRAALDVVYQRFHGLGLSDHIALVHDAKSDRKDIFKQIGSLLNQGPGSKPIRNSFREHSEQIQTNTRYLNRVAAALWNPRPCGVSPFQLYTTNCDYDGDLLDIGDSANVMTKKHLDNFLTNLVSYGEYCEKFGNKEYPLRYRKSFAQFGVLDFNGFKRDLKNAIQATRDLEVTLESNSWLAFDPGRMLELRKEIQRAALLFQMKRDAGLKLSLGRLLEEINCAGSQFKLTSKIGKIEKIEKYLSRVEKWPPPVKNFSSEEAHETIELIKIWSKRDAELLKLFNIHWWSVNHRLKKICLAKNITYSKRLVPELYYSLKSYLHWTAIEFSFENDLSFCTTEVNGDVQTVRHNLKVARAATDFVECMELLPDEVSALLPEIGEDLQNLNSIAWSKFEEKIAILGDLREKTENLVQALDLLKKFLADKIVAALEQQVLKGKKISALLDKILFHLEQDDIHLQQMDLHHAKFEDAELQLLQQCQQIFPSGNAQLGQVWSAAIVKTFYTYWIDKAEREIPILQEISTGQFDDIRKDFRNLIEEKRANVLLFIKSHLSERTEDFIAGRGQTYKSMRHQVGKKRKIWPLRKFIDEYGHEGLFDLLPCWLVSPETVSSIFPFEKEMFDIVVFDEASQCPVENGIPTLYRAKQAVVAGDEKQLRPMKLFQSGFSYDEDEYEDEIVESDSLLASAKLAFPDVMLKWHYRSLHEELINFSNHAFYNGDIQIAPNVGHSSTSPAIEWLQIDGTWANQCNAAEADAAVQLVKLLLQSNQDKTVGVITFNRTQQDHILDTIDDYLSTDIEFKTLYEKQSARPLDERPFVRNIENVQGDERDIIIFSIGYGKAGDGRVRLNFGTLNRVGGENRLNVAITRAKEKIYVLSSIDPDRDLNVSNTRHMGPKYLKEYLRYACAQSMSEDKLAKEILANFGTFATDDTSVVFESDFEEQVYDALLRNGIEVDTQVGCSGYRLDLAIRHPDDRHRYILGIECDGATYHSSRSAKERDVYRQRFLESRGWTIERILSRNWWRNKEHEIKRILGRIDELSHKRSFYLTVLNPKRSLRIQLALETRCVTRMWTLKN